MMHPTEEDIITRLQTAQSPLDADEYTQSANGTKRAAVLIPIFQHAGEWHLLYTRRTDQVESHKGQVSFPGGACDKGETAPEQTALREAEEEIGIDPRTVRVLGRLKPMLTISSFLVTPVVGVIPWPTVFKPAHAEVARIFTAPLAWLAERSNRWEFPLPGREQAVVVYRPFDGEIVWGATAMMTVDFLETIQENRQAR